MSQELGLFPWCLISSSTDISCLNSQHNATTIWSSTMCHQNQIITAHQARNMCLVWKWNMQQRRQATRTRKGSKNWCFNCECDASWLLKTAESTYQTKQSIYYCHPFCVDNTKRWLSIHQHLQEWDEYRSICCWSSEEPSKCQDFFSWKEPASVENLFPAAKEANNISKM